jgi:hypothetical protein
VTYTLVWDTLNNQVSQTAIQRDEDGAFIPMDPDNLDCQDYLAWLEEGNTPTPAQHPTQAPTKKPAFTRPAQRPR